MKSATDLSHKTYTSKGRALAAARRQHRDRGGRYFEVAYSMDDVEIIQTANGWRWHFIIEFDENAIKSEGLLKHLKSRAIA